MASLEGCPPSAAFALLRAFSAKGRAFRMPQRRTHRGGENGISSLSGRLVAQRRGGLPEPVHQLLGWWLHARGAMVSPSRAGHVGASRPGVRQPAQLDRTLARQSCCADRSGPRFGPPNCQPGRTGPRTPCTRRSSSRGQRGTYQQERAALRGQSSHRPSAAGPRSLTAGLPCPAPRPGRAGPIRSIGRHAPRTCVPVSPGAGR